MKICLDAGHYGKYNRSPAVPEYYESEMNWKLHNLLKKYLEAYGIEVTQTRSNQAVDLEVSARGRLAKGCDLLLSVHSNAVGSAVNESVDYPVVYVPLNGSGNDIGKKLADCIASTMGTVQPGRIATRRGNNGDYYGLIRGAVSVGVPGIILEHSFHTNTRSTRWLLDDSNLDKMARIEADVIAAHYGIEKPTIPEDVGAKDEAVTLYRVQVGAYSNRDNADKMLAKVKAAGFDAIMVKADGWYKIQVGAFKVYAYAEDMLEDLRDARFLGIITTKGGEVIDTDQTYSLYQFIMDVQAATGAAVDGIAGQETLSKTVTLSASRNTRHAAVLPVQKRLLALGYDPKGLDGIYGANTASAVKAFQTNHGCINDGEITAKCKTWQKLLGMIK